MTAISKAIVEELAQKLTREDCEKIQENIDSIPGATRLDKVSSEQICGGINVLNEVQKWAPTGLGAVAVIMAALSLRQSKKNNQEIQTMDKKYVTPMWNWYVDNEDKVNALPDSDEDD